jgi:hypothetical protein
MKRILLVFSIFLTIQVFGKEVTVEKAKEVAKSFLGSSNAANLRSVAPINLTSVGDVLSHTFLSNTTLKSAGTSDQELYIFKINQDNGFVIVSGDDAAIPILGYSTSMSIDNQKMPPNFTKWIENYKQQILYIRTNKIEPTAEIQNLWNGISNKVKAVESSVAPLVSTQWNQSPYVNDKCPYDNDYNELTVTGCPATAMAQILKFWEYPAKGFGFHSYQHDKYGTLSANFGSTYYDWAAMPNNINSTNDAVATLMFQCGVAVEMNYNVAAEGGSGSYVIIDPLGRYPETQTCEYAFKTYFGYASTIQGLFRADYADTPWKNLLKTELNAGRPVQYAGFGKGGHTFVCDGYDNNDYFHMNWGWGGYYDGYFLLDALNPGSGGIGSGAGTYNEGQQALIGIKPADGGTTHSNVLEIYDDVVTNKSTIAYGEDFTITTAIANNGTAAFTGDYCAAIFDMNDVFVDYVQTLTGTMNAGYYYNTDYSTSGLLSMLPGYYRVYIFSRPTGGEWVGLKAAPGDATTKDYTEIEVVNVNDITLYSEMELESTTIYANEGLSVWLDIANFSSTVFNGIFDVSLYNLEGEFVTTIEEKTGMNLPVDSHYTDGLTFSTDNVDVTPGTYLLALLHKRTGSDYEITGSTDTYINPIKVIVQGQKYDKDIYEDNNEINTSYTMSLSFSGDLANPKTTGSNIHVGNDWDYYSVNLNPQNSYTLDARLHDAYNSGNGNIYTVDALFLYSLYNGSIWSDAFDDLMPGKVTFSGTNKLYFVVSPYFLGETGTYLLDVKLTNHGVTSNPESLGQNSLSIFPNPCFNSIEVTNAEEIIQYKLFDINGRLLKSDPINQSNFNIDVSEFDNGVYFLEVDTKMNSYTHKIIKQ